MLSNLQEVCSSQDNSNYSLYLFQDDTAFPAAAVDNDSTNHAGPSSVPALDRSTRSARSGRTVRFPQRYQDFVPGSATALPHIPPSSRQQRGRIELQEAAARLPPPSLPDPPSPLPLELSPEPGELFQTQPDIFNVFRRYRFRPTLDPDRNRSPEDFFDAPALLRPKASPPVIFDEPRMTKSALDDPGLPSYTPFSTHLAASIMVWHYTKSNLKSKEETQRLVSDFICNINPAEAPSFNVDAENKNLNNFLTSSSNPFPNSDGWIESSIKIHMPPCAKKTWPSEANAPQFKVHGLHHCKLINIITGLFQHEIVQTYHLTPFTQFWKPFDDEDDMEQLYSEAYASQAMQDTYDEILSFPCNANDGLERVVAALMCWSDSTHLANFWSASVWPLYLSIGNQSKYTRVKPSAAALHHVTYFPSVSTPF